jgi:hypothetical protein
MGAPSPVSKIACGAWYRFLEEEVLRRQTASQLIMKHFYNPLLIAFAASAAVLSSLTI